MTINPTAVLATLETHLAAARRHTPFGQLFPADMIGPYRRAAQAHGLTVEAVQAMHRAQTEGAHHG